MRKWVCVPMMTLCLLLVGCGKDEASPEDLRLRWQEMTACTMEAVVVCQQEHLEWEATLRCDYAADGPCTVEVLSPEYIAGVKAVIDGAERRLEYEGAVLDAGVLSRENISPAECLPYLVDALRMGWLLEENEEAWGDVPCLRMTLEQSGSQTEILSTVWLRMDDGTPLRGELSVDGENILTVEFTSFLFCDTIEDQGA